jgi:2-amino-4-hydroxy-6-hydroxymethyldihydropteridine diphosphokinase
MPNYVYLSLGSNIEPEKNMKAALEMLANYGHVIAISSIWETAPVGLADQPNFLNAAVLLETELSAEQTKTTMIQAIEQALLRNRMGNPNAPRTMDIDIALFNQSILKLGKREIPDPDIYSRAFVALPLAEIAPDYVHPISGETLRKIALRFDPEIEGMQKRKAMENMK